MSLRLRLTLTYLLVTLVGLLLLGSGFTTLAARYTAQQRERELAGQADIYARYVAELARTPTELQSLAPNLSVGGILAADVSVRIFDRDGTLLSRTSGLGPFPSRPVLELSTNPVPLPISQSPQRRYVARPIVVDTTPIGIVELSHSTAAEMQVQRELRLLVVQATLIAALVMVFVSLLIAHSITRPIARLTARARALESGDPGDISGFLTTSLPSATHSARSRDELILLANSLDRMARQLQARIAEAESERARLAVVLATISEGVVALDTTGELLFANPAALALLNANAQETVVSRLSTLGLPLHTAVYGEREVQIDRRQLLITLHPVPATAHQGVSEARASSRDPLNEHIRNTAPRVPATVFVLRDITRLKELEQARTRFFRSISHDLRTPLTAIRGMLENLRDTAPVEQQPSLQTIEKEAERLARLVDELLHPSANGALLLTERRLVDMGMLVRELCALQQGRVRRAGLTLTCEAQANLPLVYGDPDRLKQAVLNLLDNALRVSPPGGHISVQVITIRPDPAAEAATVRLSVADNGPGVPPDLRERIWERGVRGVDLVGQRNMEDYGGSGLGLAIVREIVLAHGGWAWVEDNLPRGARFVLDLPGASLAIPGHRPGVVE